MIATPVFVVDDVTMIVMPQIQVRFEESVSVATIEQVFMDLGLGAVIEAHWVRPNTFVVEAASRSGIHVLNAANTLASREDVLWADVEWRFTGRTLLQTQVEYPPPAPPVTAPTVRRAESPVALKGALCEPMPVDPPPDPLFQISWGLEQFNDIDVDARGAWEVCVGNSDIIVAVLDDGVQLDHPDLPNLVPGADFSNDNACDTEDCMGQPMNRCENHGTTVAGIIGSTFDIPPDPDTAEPVGGVGIAPGVSIMPIRVASFWSSGLSCVPQLTQYQVGLGVAYAASNGARVTSLSWNFPFDTPVSTLAFIYEAAYEEGVTNFNSAGNDNRDNVYAPGNLPTVNSVSAINFLGTLFFVDSTFASNYGANVSFTAPGQAVITTDRTGDDGYVDDSGPYGADFLGTTGTSYACPFVSGVAALVLSVKPSLGPGDVLFVLRKASMDLGVAGRDENFGYGLPSSERAIQIALELVFQDGFETGDLSAWSGGLLEEK